jgi:phosphatidylserine/phosphatidylglycerophosphate/cardiolipin synthase-like enzyme
MADDVAIAIANNDVALIAWRYAARIDGCLGFAIERRADAGDWELLPAWVGFQGQSNAAWQRNTTAVWPVQKFEWKDLTARPGGTYTYRVTPMVGQPDALARLEARALTTGAVTLTPQRGSFSTYFNRGILSTQFLSHQIKAGPSGAPDFRVLKDRIDQPGDPLRMALAGQILEGLETLLKRATTQGGSCHASLYELNDPELVQQLLQQPGLQIILSNTGTDDAENKPARQALHDRLGDAAVIDRFVPSGHIGHNKFVVYADADGSARAVLLGSTNWTDTAVCAQANNALILENDTIAAAYLDYWNRLKQDTPDSGKARQAAELREANSQPGASDVPVDGGAATVWFSPNTPHARQSHPGADETTPPDLAAVFSLMDNAKQAILFLEFQPGSPSVVDHAATVANANPGLFVRGATTDPKAVDVFNTTLVHRAGEDPVEVVPASAITDQFAFWQQELLKSGPQAHAIIHDKIVVIDPMSDDCVVVTGSHNQGYRASYNNDENLLIVRGHKALAQAYAVHVMDVYDHYRFRYVIQKEGTNAFSGLDPTDGWQDKYFDPNNPARRDTSVWLGTLPGDPTTEEPPPPPAGPRR